MSSANSSFLRFTKITENAFVPVKGSEQAAGYDLKSAYTYVIPGKDKGLIKTDLQFQVPAGTYGRIAPRSGFSWKHHVSVAAGVIDADYRGNVGVVLFNHGDTDLTIEKGDRIAQLICEKIVYPELVEETALNNTERGACGFGSTGIK